MFLSLFAVVVKNKRSLVFDNYGMWVGENIVVIVWRYRGDAVSHRPTFAVTIQKSENRLLLLVRGRNILR